MESSRPLPGLRTNPEMFSMEFQTRLRAWGQPRLRCPLPAAALAPAGGGQRAGGTGQVVSSSFVLSEAQAAFQAPPLRQESCSQLPEVAPTADQTGELEAGEGTVGELT